jgi:4a-hydroxytetrahydrobiopterin dehydratase
MSEQGWHDFLAAEGIEDWVVLHGGATAVFRVGSLREAACLAEAIAATPGIEGSRIMLTLADGSLIRPICARYPPGLSLRVSARILVRRLAS